jgi:rare lipoprotein A
VREAGKSVVWLALPALLLLAGCGHKHVARRSVPPPPTIAQPEQPSAAGAEANANEAQAEPSRSGHILYTEIGYASWYGPSFNGRKAANGEIYDQNLITAAHRTIPLNSIVRVTNLKTGETVTVRITDRGPFVPDRIIDLSKAAAQRVGVYVHGTAKVKLEVLKSPAPIDEGGKWCVQIGAFDDPGTAIHMKQSLARKYHSARVLEFPGPRHDWWVRVRVLNDDKEKAVEIARDSHTPQGAVYLVRLD